MIVIEPNPVVALADIAAGASLIVGGRHGIAEPDLLFAALATNPVARDLSIISRGASGLEALANRIATLITPDLHTTPSLLQAVRAGTCMAATLPRGILDQMLRALAAGQPGVLSTVGLGLLPDPGQATRLGPAAADLPAKRLTMDDGDRLLYHCPLPGWALLRAGTADENGAVSDDRSPCRQGLAALAGAVKAGGGKVIVQVDRIVPAGRLPAPVDLPPMLVDILVPADRPQITGQPHDPSLSGELALRTAAPRPMPLDLCKIVLRRAALLARPDWTVDQGDGWAADFAAILAEEGVEDRVRFCRASGVIGGVSARWPGTAHNPLARLDPAQHADWLHGQGLDLVVLPFRAADRAGRILVDADADGPLGCGDTLDRLHAARRVAFVGPSWHGPMDVEIIEGRLHPRQDGDDPAIIDRLPRWDFDGRAAVARGCDVTVITERCVLKPTPRGLMITEIAPGLRLVEDILPRLGARPLFSPQLTAMEPKLFRPEPLGLERIYDRRAQRDRGEN